jgi:hypothetical protein
MSNIQELKGLVNRRSGLAQQNRFMVRITPPQKISVNGSDFNILCENCTLPGRQITTFDYQLLRQSIKVPNGYINEEVAFSFLLTNDFYVKKIIIQL